MTGFASIGNWLINVVELRKLIAELLRQEQKVGRKT